MGLINETNEQYYAGEQTFIAAGGIESFTWTGDTNLITTTATTNTNFEVTIDGVEILTYTTVGNTITLTVGAGAGQVVAIKLLQPTVWENLGSYEYITLNDVVDNFMVAYVGSDKLIPRIKRTDVIFHAKRGLQEFSYDTLKSLKSQEVDLPPSLQIPIPQDYVNYTRLSWVDANGVQRTIYPADTLTMNPQQPIIQDDNGEYIQDNLGANTLSAQTKIAERWRQANDEDISGQFSEEVINGSNIWNWSWWKTAYGQRYGLDPQWSQTNGWFTINNREGKFSFSSNLAGMNIIIEYLSDGLAYDADSKIPKMIEEAMYMHIAHAVLSTKSNVPEYVVHRFKKDRRAALRNAKIRLQNLKLDELVQVMRNKSKWIKH